MVPHCGHLSAIKFEVKVAYNVPKYQGAYRVAINQKFSANKCKQIFTKRRCQTNVFL